MTSIDDVLAAVRECEEGYGLPHVEHESAADCPDVRAAIEQALAKVVYDACTEIPCDGDSRVPCAGLADDSTWRRCGRCRQMREAIRTMTQQERESNQAAWQALDEAAAEVGIDY